MGTSSKPEIDTVEIDVGELKRYKDFTGIKGDGSKFASHKSRSMFFVRRLDD